MISVPVYNPAGQQVSTIEVDPAAFGSVVNRQLLHDSVVMHQANLRVGTHNTRRRGDVSGSKKKLFKQKGTGNARVGTKRTNKRRGGGVAHGPVPRDYSYQMPKKARRLATRMALLSKFEDNEALVVSGFSVAEPKTKQVVGLLKSLGLEGQTCLFATESSDKNLYLSARNIEGVQVLPIQDLFAFAILRRKRLVLTPAAIESLMKKPSATGEAE